MKYIFIDSSQYRHIFSKSEGFSDDVYNLLNKLIDNEHVQLILPQQTRDEVERNRFYDWLNKEVNVINNKINSLINKSERIKNEYRDYDFERAIKKIKGEIESLEKEKEVVPKRFTNLRSKQNKKINTLFKKAYFVPDNQETLMNADYRFKKGNPPYDDEKFGDALIWESLLLYLKTQKTNRPELIFVAADKRAWGDKEFHLWLAREFKSITRGKILYSKKLQEIPWLTAEEQEKIREKENEELKKNAIEDFVNSGSFVGAGENARKLSQFKQLLNEDDYRKIFIASLNNHEIYQSWFTADPLNMLFNKGDGYVVEALERASVTGWEKFCNFYGCQLKRYSDESIRINKEDAPF